MPLIVTIRADKCRITKRKVANPFSQSRTIQWQNIRLKTDNKAIASSSLMNLFLIGHPSPPIKKDCFESFRLGTYQNEVSKRGATSYEGYEKVWGFISSL